MQRQDKNLSQGLTRRMLGSIDLRIPVHSNYAWCFSKPFSSSSFMGMCMIADIQLTSICAKVPMTPTIAKFKVNG